MKRRVVALLALVAVCGVPIALGAGDKPIVAVFNVEAKLIIMDMEVLDGLCEHLATLLTATGRFQVVPRSELKKRLLEQKTESFKACYDQSCQVELGRELAAEKTLSTQVIKLGKTCKANITLYDLKKAATESAASVSGGCGLDDIVASLEKAVAKLIGGAPVAVAPPAPGMSRRSKTGPAGIEWVYSKPAGIEFTKSEVTVAQYRACVHSGSCGMPKEKVDNKYCNWGNSGRDNHPINCVDCYQAKDFCSWAGGKLPTEEELYAEASAKGTREYPWGNREVTCDYAIWGDGKRTDGCGRDSTWPVCSKKRGNSVSGLCDMSGNVWEWTSSSEGSAHVVHGGSWRRDDTGHLRASFRFRFLSTSRNDSFGFRCGRSPR